jgi:hypothetical protein
MPKNVIYFLTFVLIPLASMASQCKNSVIHDTRWVFGVDFRWETPSSEVQDRLSENATSLQKEYSISMDPDCIWRVKNGNKCENPFATETQSLEKFTDDIKKETLGYFDIRWNDKAHGVRRDFSGISEGFILERLARVASGPWLGDFAGDIFFSGDFVPTRPITIADPLTDRGPYAKVEMTSGWMISSSSRILGAKMRNPIDPESSWKEDFQRVIFFAGPNFNGTRLDAWTTGAVVGGWKVLNHLWDLKPYKGQWAYFFFDSAGRPGCSSNLHCSFENPKARVIKVSF